MNRKWPVTIGICIAVLFQIFIYPPFIRLASAENGKTVYVAAASDLRFALSVVADRFENDHSIDVKFSFGSSGNLARQILQGAPFDIFLSADDGYANRLVVAGLTDGKGMIYAIGRIGLMSRMGSRLNEVRDMKQLAALVKTGSVKTFAIANPKHAPYGRAARECLEFYGLWNVIKPHLIIGENATQATLFAMSKRVEGGIVPLSLATTPNIAGKGRFLLLPENCHKPLRQRMVLLKSAGKQARSFFKFLQSDITREILTKHHFKIPEE